MKQNCKGLFLGILIGTTMFTATGFASNDTVQKELAYRNINIVIDGNEITPTDANGNYVEPFIMDGTTYLPVRAVANAFGKDVSWDDTTNTVSLDEKQITAETIAGVYTFDDNGYIFTLTLNADNTGSLTDGYTTENFSWTLDGNTLTLNNPNYPDDPAILSVNGNQLIIVDEVDDAVLTKKTETATITIIEPGTLQKDVTYRDIKIVVDGNEIIPTDANGNPVEPFIMDGTTYLPVRAVANAFGKEVGWDDTTSTVYLEAQLAESNNVVGTYVMVNPDPASTERFTLILKENNKASISDGYDTAHITWYQSGNTITLVPPSGNGDSITLIIDGDRLISGEEGDEGAFIKAVSLPNPMAQVTMKTVTVDKTDANKPIVTIEMENGGIIKAELYPDVAPITVENFISLIEKGFYDGLTFHRNIPGFVIQGGCPVGNGTGGPGYTIKGEFSSNGVKNDLKHTRGVLSMARAQDPDSAGSQFFIMHADAPHLDGEYAAFGMVIEGMDVVDNIANSGM